MFLHSPSLLKPPGLVLGRAWVVQVAKSHLLGGPSLTGKCVSGRVRVLPVVSGGSEPVLCRGLWSCISEEGPSSPARTEFHVTFTRIPKRYLLNLHDFVWWCQVAPSSPGWATRVPCLALGGATGPCNHLPTLQTLDLAFKFGLRTP